jgi:polar amino acid transport system permease protein
MDFDFSPIIENWRYLLGGLGVTLALSAVTVLASLLLGTGIGIARVFGPAWLRLPLIFYIDSMRAVPVLVVLVWTFFAVPILSGLSLPPFWAAVVALTVHIAAYVAEIVRAGIESIRPGQVWAGLALGMSRADVVRRIVLPQAVVRMLPAFGSIVSITIKDTAIATVIAVPEYMKRSETLAGQSYHPIEVFTFAMIVYFVILFPVTRLIDVAYRRVAHLGRS